MLFIDEIDGIGQRSQGRAGGGAESELNRIINRVLVEMDGFDPLHNVVVVGATNHEDNIDEALRRPGRFDMLVRLALPMLPDRQRLFDLYLGRLHHDGRADTLALARMSAGMSPANIANTVNKAASTAAELGAERVGADHLLAVGSVERSSIEPRSHGYPTAIVSTPFTPMADKLFASAGQPDAPTLKPEALRQMVHNNLTHQFRVARKPSLIDGTQLVLVSPSVPAGSNTAGAGFALACFIKRSLHAFTATLAMKDEHPVLAVPAKQINHTRRARSGERRNQADHQEEVKRFGRAVLLAGAPLPDAEDPRYRSRICLGMAITLGVSLPERGG